MGKKVKKKAVRSAQKEKRVPTTVSQESIPTSETLDDGVSVVKEKTICHHLDKGVNLEKVSSKMESSEPLKCDDCREGVVDRRASKGKGKHGKKKGGVSSKSDSKAIWVCLECGQFSCGGAGFPTTPQSHATRHAKQNRHPLAVQFANPNLRWCFPCNTLIPVQTSEENSEKKDVLSDIVKIIKGRSSQGPSLDVEDVWFASGSITSEVKSSGNIVSNSLEDRGGYMTRGLVNLGNTCFFNSVLQNLLAMDKLRDYFLRLDGPVGPLTVSLKKLFIETNTTSGPRNVINPRSFFGCLCDKAPQFRGYQQHDSHELLRCLLDGLSTEESGARKRASSSEEDGNAHKLVPTFVDAIFGGQISSTVCCLECGHTSIVYEPFLDLSLPLPTKRSPSKKSQTGSRSKKPKLPPKRFGKFRPKINKASDSSPAHCVSNIQTDGKPSILAESVEAVAENFVSPSVDSTQQESFNLGTMDSENDSVSQSLLVTQGLEHKQILDHLTEKTMTTSDYLEPIVVSNDHDTATVISSDFSSWLDYLQPAMVSNDSNDHVTSQQNNVTKLVAQDPEKELIENDDVLLQLTMESSKQVDSLSTNEPPPPLTDDSSWLVYLEPSSLSNDHVIASQNDYVSTVQDSWEDEPQVQESEILMLPYKEITSTTSANEVTVSSVSCEQDSQDFDGFGDLFNEPEVAVGPSVKPMSDANGVAETGFMSRNSSESDPDEVDNSDSPVSVQSCLAYFTSLELLSKTEHAWHCERCSKVLLEQKMKLKNKHVSEIVLNGGKNEIPNDLSSSDIDCFIPNGVRNSSSDENLNVSQSCTTSLNVEPTQEISGVEEGEGTEDDEMDSKSVKVTRDATKRILINKVPPILTIHLKRFSQDARGRLSKLNGHVDFRDTIDLRPYMDPSFCKDRDKYKYRLVGVVEHLGTMRGGHYVAYVRGGAKGTDNENKDYLWYHVSDAYVREATSEEVLRCEAYILFYKEI